MAAPKEFQAVVLAAGKGSRMPEITADKAKCLLPIGGKPLVWYPLYKLQQAGFKDAILIVNDARKTEIQSTLEKTGLTLKIDYVSTSEADEMGTADSLRLLQDKITSDLLIFSCDLITNFDLLNVINEFRKHNASLCSVFFNSASLENVGVPGPKTKHKPEKDLVGLDMKTNRLVFLASASDFENDVLISKSLLKKHTDLRVYSNLIDSHIYVMSNWVFKYLCKKNSIATFKGEFVPHLIKKQLAKKPSHGKMEDNPSVLPKDESTDIFQYITDDNQLDRYIKEVNAYSDHFGDLKPAHHGDLIKCFAYICGKEAFGIRVNNLQTFWSTNTKISDIWDQINPNFSQELQHPDAEVKSTQVEKCFLWDSCKLNEKTSFKNSVIGAKTEVKSFSRVFNSIVMNNVLIHEKVALENCIVCDGAIIKSGCKLKNCIVGSKHNLDENSEHNSEVLTDDDKLMEF